MLIIARCVTEADVHGMMLIDGVQSGQIHTIRIHRIGRHLCTTFRKISQRKIVGGIHLETETALLLFLLTVCDAERGTRQ